MSLVNVNTLRTLNGDFSVNVADILTKEFPFDDVTGFVNVKDDKYGAKGDGITDDTAAIQLALNTGEPVFLPQGNYKLTDALIAVNGQTIRGAGRLETVFVIGTDFNLSASFVLRLGTEGSAVSGGEGGQLFDIGFSFKQADQGVRDSCTKYPWAISIKNLPRAVIDRVRISSAWNGINATGNCGGCYIGFIEVGALNRGVYVDGALDFVHGGHWHFWPFGMSTTANLVNVFYDTAGRALVLGACDGFNVDTIATFAQAIECTSTANAQGIPMTINKLMLDSSQSCLLMPYGYMYVDSLYNTSNAVAYPCISLSGNAKLVVGKFSGFTSRQQATLRTQDNAILEVNGGYIYDVYAAYQLAICYGTSQISLNNMVFDHNGITLTQPKIYQAESTAVLRVNNCNWRNTGSGTAVQFSGGNDNSCLVNSYTGSYGVVVPVSTSSARIAGTFKDIYSSATGALYANEVIGNVKRRRLSSTTTGSQLTIAHGIPSLQLKALSVTAFYKDSSGIVYPCTVVGIDGTNINVTTGSATAGNAVTVVVQYVDTTIW